MAEKKKKLSSGIHLETMILLMILIVICVKILKFKFPTHFMLLNNHCICEMFILCFNDVSCFPMMVTK